MHLYYPKVQYFLDHTPEGIVFEFIITFTRLNILRDLQPGQEDLDQEALAQDID